MPFDRLLTDAGYDGEPNHRHRREAVDAIAPSPRRGAAKSVLMPRRQGNPLPLRGTIGEADPVVAFVRTNSTDLSAYFCRGLLAREARSQTPGRSSLGGTSMRARKSSFALVVASTILAATLASSTPVLAQAQEPVLAAAKREAAPLLDTLKELVAIESGSRDLEGLARLAELIASRLRALGGEVELLDATAAIDRRMGDAPDRVGQAVRATFKGTGARKILLIAHMDTVYARGMAVRQPFRTDGDRAYGLGISDDKQGIAVILHTLSVLKASASVTTARSPSSSTPTRRSARPARARCSPASAPSTTSPCPSRRPGRSPTSSPLPPPVSPSSPWTCGESLPRRCRPASRGERAV